MKILHVSDRLRVTGPDERCVRDLCQELPKRGHETLLVHGEGPELGEPERVRCYRVPELGRTVAHGQMWSTARLLQIIRAETPDVVHVHRCDNPWLVRTIGRLVPTVKTLHDYGDICPTGLNMDRSTGELCDRVDERDCRLWCVMRTAFFNGRDVRGRRGWLRRFRDRFDRIDAIRAVGHLVVPSRFMRETLLRRGFGPESVVVNPPGVCVSDEPVRMDRSAPRVLFVGRHGRADGLERLLRALVGLKEPFELNVIGPEKRGQEPFLQQDFVKKRLPTPFFLRRLMRRLGPTVQVHFFDGCSAEAWKTFCRRARVVVMPRLWPEPFSIEGLDAMAEGRPVVAYDTGAVGEWLIDGRTGFLVPVGDIERLRERISELLRDVNKAEGMGMAAVEQIRRRFSMARHLSVLEGIYGRTAAGGSRWNRERSVQRISA